MSKAELENALRNEILEVISKALEEHFQTDILPVSASEVTLPLVDAENNEKFGLIKVSIPRGTRTGDGGYTPYDGYSAHEDYKADIEEKQAKKKASEEKKANKEAERQRKREAKEVKKALANLEQAVKGVSEN